MLDAQYGYNLLGQVTNVTYRKSSGGTLVSSFDYLYNAAGMITNKQSIVDGTQTATAYTYDELNRLKSEKVDSDPAVSYTYDLAGNRLTAGASTFTYTDNRLDGVLYDAAGNVTNMVQDGVTLDLTWNVQGQLTSVSTNGVFAESYQYDPLGRRVSTTDASGTVYHVYDGDQCVADMDGAGNVLLSYTWGAGIDNLLAVTVHGDGETNSYYAVKDHLNSVHALVDESGDAVLTVSYDAWGTPDNSQFTIDNSQYRLRYLFQGRERSFATGLYNFRARWYSPDIGRWLSPDPIGLEGGLNLYEFCGNSPVNFVDPDGLWGVMFGDIQIGSGDSWLAFDNDSWEDLQDGAYATLDGIIPFADPFQSKYTDECGNVDDVFRTSQKLAAASRDVLLAAAGTGLASKSSSVLAKSKWFGKGSKLFGRGGRFGHKGIFNSGRVRTGWGWKQVGNNPGRDVFRTSWSQQGSRSYWNHFDWF